MSRIKLGLTSFIALTIQTSFTVAHGQGYLAAISDAEMVSESYHHRQLADPRPYLDTLSIFDLSNPSDFSIGTITASNGMNAPASPLAVTPDGNIAFVIEMWEPRQPSDKTLGDLKRGNHVRAFDLSDPNNPKLIKAIETGFQPTGVTINASGTLAMVVGANPESHAMFIPISDTELGEPSIVKPELIARPDLRADGIYQGLWHPSGKVVAMLLPFRSQVSFFKVNEDDNGKVSLTPWGTVQTNKFPWAGEFSANGRYLITSDVQWGIDVPFLWDTTSTGVLTSIKLGSLDNPSERPGHSVIGGVQGGMNAEFIAISQKRNLLATADIHQSTKPEGHPLYLPMVAISLFQIHPENGTLSFIQELKIKGNSAQGLSFDKSGSRLFLGIGEYRDEDRSPETMGGIEILNVLEGDKPTLVHSGKRLRLPMSVHGVIYFE
ncbi:hypothetical protein [Marinomonas sp. THO17]|uniref:hypothetical protein n=1 Tax=Marinomonas sp. THO17 TaxID=3149048 RepID=UPI00336BCA94